MKAAVVVLSDPKGGEEALGRLFNALSTVHEFKSKGDEVKLVFSGTGTRWVEEVSRPDHPAHALYESIRDKFLGVSCGCAEAFGAAESARSRGAKLLKDYALPGTSGIAGLRGMVADGYDVLTF